MCLAISWAVENGAFVRLTASAVGLFVVLAIAIHNAAANHLPELPGEQRSGATAPDLKIDLDLDLLGDDLLKKLDVAPPVNEGRSRQTPRQPPQSGDALPGEDLGEAGQKLDPLEEIGRQMREIERRILAHDTSSDTQALQKAVSDELAALIDQLQKSEASATAAQKAAGPQQEKQGGRGEGAGQSASAETADRPAGESRDRLGSSAESSAEMQDVHALLREVWGHLPQRVRGQMQNSSVEQFLPQYDLLIREYFKRLTRQNDAAPNN